MKRVHKRVLAGCGALAVVGAGLYALGLRVLYDSGRLHILRKVSYVNGKPADGREARPAGPLKSIEILTPDSVILENMAKEEFMARVDDVVKAGEGALGGVAKIAKLTLTVVFHQGEETDNIVAAEAGDEAEAALLADAVDKADKDVRTKAGDVSVRFHFETGGGEPGKRKSLVLVPGEAAGPGDPVPGPEDEKAAMAAVAALSRPPGPAPTPWTSAVCSPSVWKRLLSLDPALASKGTSTKAHRDGLVQEARTFMNKPGGLEALVRSPGFQKLMAWFAAGHARAATTAERAAIYANIPYEIKGEPATVIEKGGDVLYVSASKGLLWLDVLSDYDRSGALAAAPAPEEPEEAPEAPEAGKAFLSACKSEAGLFCAGAGEDAAVVEACLKENREKVLPACARALR